METGSENRKQGALEKIDAMEQKRGRNHPLDQMRAWMREYQVGRRPIPTVQVVGTNGKGSVCRWLSDLLEKKNIACGLFTSPHLLHHCERLRMDGKPISLGEWEAIYDQWQPLFEAERFTMFEMDFWMALDWFERENAGCIILEAGMGGAYDATSACQCTLGLITHTGLDHMAFLGDTLEEIAASKAGMIRGMPVLCMESDPACQKVYANAAAKAGSPIAFLADTPMPEGLVWPERLPQWQQPNFLLAAAAAQKLGVRLSRREMQEVLDGFVWKGRFEILRKTPLCLLDGAHNPDGVGALVDSLLEKQKSQPGWQIERIYFSVLADKKAQTMLNQLEALHAQIRLVHFDTPRLADLETLARANGLQVVSLDQMKEELTSQSQPVLICGSLYFASQVLAWNEACHPFANGEKELA